MQRQRAAWQDSAASWTLSIHSLLGNSGLSSWSSYCPRVTLLASPGGYPARPGRMRLEQAEVFCYRIFEVGEAIDLERARLLLRESTRLKLTREGSEYIQLANPPLSAEFDPRQLPLRSGLQDARTAVRIFHHGSMSIRFALQVPPGTTLEALIPFADEVYDSPVVEQTAAAVMLEVRQLIAPTIEDPQLWDRNEGYTVIVPRRIEGRPSAKELLAEPALPRLLLGETKQIELSENEQRDVLSHTFSYTTHDLSAIDWNAARVYEPDAPGSDVPTLLEIANAQLLEFRYFDDVLDKELGRVYDAIGAHRPRLFKSPYKKLLRELSRTLIELSEFVERVENALRIVGDTYLAKVYEGAVQQLRIEQWQQQVTRKQGVLNHAYELLKGETDTNRALMLELAVVLLIVIEVLVAMLGFVPH